MIMKLSIEEKEVIAGILAGGGIGMNLLLEGIVAPAVERMEDVLMLESLELGTGN